MSVAAAVPVVTRTPKVVDDSGKWLSVTGTLSAIVPEAGSATSSRCTITASELEPNAIFAALASSSRIVPNEVAPLAWRT